MLLAVRYDNVAVTNELFDSITYQPSTARALIRAQRNVPHRKLHGTIDGDLDVSGTIDGSLFVSGTIDGSLFVSGTIAGDLDVFGTIAGSLFVSGTIDGDVDVYGTMDGDVDVYGTIDGSLDVYGTIDGDLDVTGSIAGNLYVSGTIAGNLYVGGLVEGDVSLTGTAQQAFLTGRFGSNIRLTPKTKPGTVTRLASVRTGQFAAAVFIGDGVDISSCDFRQCSDIARFELVGSDLFANDNVALTNPPNDKTDKIPDREMATIYRQLRVNLEDRKNRPEASRFYRAEMDARLASTNTDTWSGRIEHAVLWLYRTVSGYGQSIFRPITAFAVMSLVGYIIFAVNGLDPDPTTEPSPGATWHETWMFSVRSMLSFLSPPDADLTTADLAGQILLRFAGPTLLALGILGVREKVAR